MSKIEVNTVDTQCGTNLTVGAACKSVTVAGNDVRSNAYKAADGGNIASQSGTTITLGASGDTITLASGATQSGFGRTGTVDWDTTAKTASFTAVSGNGYFVNTTSGAITVTLPASPSAGDIVSLADYTNTWGTNGVIVGRNGSNIGGISADANLQTQGQSVTFIYVDGTEGWKNIQDSTSNVTGNPFISATGGTITTCGDYKIHTFTGPGTFTVTGAGQGTPTNPSTVDYLVVAGGGAGANGGGSGGGAGGAGGYRESHCTANSGSYTASPLATTTGITVTATSYPITVGAGGSSCSPTAPTRSGSNSIFSTITSTGGGGGGSFENGGDGGGGGGAGGGFNPAHGPYFGGSGNTPPVSPSQGFGGGNANTSCNNDQRNGGGGGGALAAGNNGLAGTVPAPCTSSGSGGNGTATAISGSSTSYSGGGGGAKGSAGPGQPQGGSGGGGNGSYGQPIQGQSPSGAATAGTVNTGGGGGGWISGSCGYNPGSVGTGGSGVVIIRYKYQ